MRSANAVALNMLNRMFDAASANRKWVTDFTHLWTAEGWCYVAAVNDLFSRRVVGWPMSAPMTVQLVNRCACNGDLAAGDARGPIASLRIRGTSIRVSRFSASWPTTASPAV